MAVTPTYDAVVVGLGAMGSAAAYHLAKTGRRVLGLDRYDVPHEHGSSHGETRIIRLGYFEHPDYVPLLRRAYEAWRELEARTGERLLITNGSIDASREGHGVFDGSLRSCRIWDIPHEVLTPSELARRFPGYRLEPDMLAVFQPDGGFLLPEKCIEAYLGAATAEGAEIRTREEVLGWDEDGPLVSVRTTLGRYTAGALVLTVGAWVGDLVPGLRDVAIPERQVLLWLRPLEPELFTPERFPVFNIAADDGAFYGFPSYKGTGLKLGRYGRGGEPVHPDSMDRRPGASDEVPLRDFVRRIFPDAAGPTAKTTTCLFTNTPDEHFIVDRLLRSPPVAIGAGFSGHGFKFASVVGELLANLVMDVPSSLDYRFLRLGRFDP